MWIQRFNGNPWDPFADVRAFVRETFAPEAHTCTWAPAVDIVESAAGVDLYADLPGLSRETIDIRVEDGSLTLRAERKPAAAEGTKVRASERPQGVFTRSFRLGEDLDPSAIVARYEAGVLHLHVPKRPESQPRRIEVKVE